MPRSLRTGTPLELDSEITKTEKRLKKELRIRRSIYRLRESNSPSRFSPPFSSTLSSTSSSIPFSINTESEPNSDTDSEPERNIEQNMGDGQPDPPLTLRQMLGTNIVETPLCINFPDIPQNCELKTNLLHALPTFHGLDSEDPHRHLKEFHVICTSMRPHGMTVDATKLRAFPFTLADAAKEWLYYLTPGSVNTWTDMATLFLHKYFPESKAEKMRREIRNAKQGTHEPIHTYWDRFKQLLNRCPDHGLGEGLILDTFIKGLTKMELKFLNSSAGGNVRDRDPVTIRRLIKDATDNSEASSQADEFLNDPPRSLNATSGSSHVDARIDELTKVVLQLAGKKVEEKPKKCGICLKTGHFTDECPSLQEDEEVNAMGGGWQGQSSGSRPYHNNNNQNNQWRNNNPNYNNYNNSGYHQQHHNPPFQQNRQIQPQNQQPNQANTSLEEIVKSLALSQTQFQQDTKASIQNLERQVTQLANSVGKIEQQGKLPSQTESSTKHNASVVSLRNGKQYEGPSVPEEDDLVRDEKVVDSEKGKERKVEKEVVVEKDDLKVKAKITHPPFPARFDNSKKEKEGREIMETFKKIEVNIPLLDAIKQIPKYAKFLKELCTSKRKLKGHEAVCMGQHSSAVVQRKMPPKCEDPGVFTVPCKVGNGIFKRSLVDLGASINIMPYHLYTNIGNVGSLKPTSVVIHLADRSTVFPVGILEDVLVQVDGLVFPADFYILDMVQDDSLTTHSIILGRPFLATSATKIDCLEGTLSMEFDGEMVKFDIFEAMKYPPEEASVNFVSTSIGSLSKNCFEVTNKDPLDVVLNRSLTMEDAEELIKEFSMDDEIKELVASMEMKKPVKFGSIPREPLPTTHAKLVPSLEKAPELDLKPLPEHLKYVHLGEKETLPVIVSNKLTPKEEDELVKMLKKYKSAIGWTIADIKGLSPALCMHKILMEDDFKPSRQPQRRLNPPMMDVVKKEILKLLDAGVIYPISDSKWVSPVQVVPKKAGVTVVKNDDGDMVPTRVQSGWRVCIDYRRLNTSTRKDHFPLPFIDQMLERLAGKSHYCCLDGFSGFHQIPVAPEDQEKTTFTCPFGTFAYRRMPFGLCNAPATFQRCMVSIFSEYVEDIIEVFMDDFTVHGDSFSACLENLEKIMKRCIETDLVLNFEKCHFMVDRGLILGHVVSSKGLEVDKAKIDVIKSLPYPVSVREVRSFLGHAGFYRRFIKDFSKITNPMCKLLCKDSDFEFGEDCKKAFDLLKEMLTSAPIIQSPRWDLPFEVMCEELDGNLT